MNIDSTFKVLENLGLKINDYKLFGEFVRKNGNSYEDSINKIEKAKIASDKKINYTDFEKIMVDFFKEIQMLINKDSLFGFSNEKDIDNFRSFFQGIIDKYIIIYKLKDDKDNCKKIADELVVLKSEIDNINSNQVALTPDQIIKINDLKFKIDFKNMEYRKLLLSIEESNKIITKYSNKNEFVKLIWMINKDMSTLSDLMNKLSITNETRGKLTVVLDKINEYLKKNEIEYINDINGFINICNLAGVTSKEKVESIEVVDNHVNSGLVEDTKVESDSVSKEAKLPSLEVGDLVMYNSFLDFEGYNYDGMLKPNDVYKVSSVRFDDNGNEMFYLEGSDIPFPAYIFDFVPKKDFKKEHSSNVVSDSYSNESSFDLREAYFKALEGLRNKKVSSYIKNVISKLTKKYYDDEIEDVMNMDNYSPDELLNLEEFSKIYNQVKSGKKR